MTQIKYLTRIEAITAMIAGHKVTHLYFFEDEWVKYHGNDSYQFDDGVICGMYDMWKNRSGGNWETGWSIVEEPENKEVLVVGKDAISGEQGKGDDTILSDITVRQNLKDAQHWIEQARLSYFQHKDKNHFKKSLEFARKYIDACK